MEEQQPVQRPNRYIPTYTRVWQYRWVIRGIPNGPTFWRPIDGWAAITFLVVMFVDWRIVRRLGIAPGFYGGILAYVGLPLAAATYVTRLNRGGKALHVWLWDRAAYWLGPKVWDRLEPVPPESEHRPVMMEAPVAVYESGNWWAL